MATSPAATPTSPPAEPTPAANPAALPHREIIQGLTIALETDGAETAGALISHYKLLQKIGEGGFGNVWMAEQLEPIHRRVALKILKAGLDTKEVIARFEAERQALALMDHPSIARVFDAGATATGRPFFVMELVRGIPITHYCDECRMPAEARLRLLISVCLAVQHAHQKGVIHRDLKPSNVLVTLHDGVPVPKIIDFGIAKATSAHLTDKTLFTQFHSFVGTPVYTSPEQMEMSGLDIDTRSDIYSLGVLLYELLTGRPPFDPERLVKSGLEAMRRTIRETDPPRPSQRLTTLPAAERTTIAHQRNTEAAKLTLLLRGDVDWIVMRCLEKNRVRRYDTAAALATDLQRHLQNEPIAARPPSELYRLGKFVRRHRIGVAAVAAIALSLVGGLITASALFVRERAAHQRAVAAEASEAGLRQQAEAARVRETERVARTALTLADQLLEQGRTAEGLAYLVQAARKDPGNHALAPRLASILTTHNFLQPEGAPLQLGSRVLLNDFSADGQRLRILCEDGTLAAVNLASGEVRRGKSPSPPTKAAWVGATKTEGALLCQDGVVRVFSWDTMQLVREIRFEKRGVWARPFENERGLMVLRLEDQSRILVEITTGQTQSLPWLQPAADYEFTPDGSWWTVNPAYLSSHELQLYDSHTGEKRKTLTLGGPLQAHFLSPDGSREVTFVSSEDHGASSLLMQIWTMPDLEPLAEAQLVEKAAGPWPVFVPRFSADSRWLIVATPNGSQVYSLVTGKKSGVYLDGAGGTVSLPPWLSPDGRRLISVAMGVVRIWDTATGQPVGPPMRHDGEIRSMKCSANGETLLTTCSDGFARLWDTATGRLLAEPILQQAIAMVASLSPDGTRLVIGSVGGTVYGLRADRRVARPLALPRSAPFLLPALFSKNDSARLLWFRRDQALMIDAASGHESEGPWIFPEPLGSFDGGQRGIGLRSDQRALVVFTASGIWQAWAVDKTGITRVVTLEDAPGGNGWLGFSPTGDRVAFIADEDRWRVRFWDLRTGKPAGPPCVQEALMMTTGIPGAFSPDGRHFVAGTVTGMVKVWDVATGRALRQVGPLRNTSVNRVAYNPDGTRIVTANDWGEAQLWDAATGQPASAILHHSGVISSATFSADGKFLATSSTDRTARVWDGHRGTPVSEPMRHASSVRSALFSADGSRVATSSYDGTVRVWETKTGQPVTALLRHPGPVHLADFSPDGRFVRTASTATATGSGTLWLWSVPPPAREGPVPEWLLQLATIRATKIIDEAGLCIDFPAGAAQLDEVRHELAALPQDAPFAGWGRWMLNDRADRSIAPEFTITPTEADALTAKFSAMTSTP